VQYALKRINKTKEMHMKTTIVLVLAAFFCLSVGHAFAQMAQYDAMVAGKIAKGQSGNFKNGVVVSCDAAKNTCTIKGPKQTKTASMVYAQYNGGFNAAKELQAGDKVSGQWQTVQGQVYITLIVKD
jgi:hypothetical protein